MSDSKSKEILSSTPHLGEGETGVEVKKAPIVVVCAWCQDVQLSSLGVSTSGSAWTPQGGLEAGAQQKFEQSQQSHGICPTCKTKYFADFLSR